MKPNLIDTNLKVTKTLPTGGTLALSPSIDLGLSTRADNVGAYELQINNPVLNTTQLPDAQTLTAAVYHDTDSAGGTKVLIADKVLVSTGAGGAGAVAKSINFHLPISCNRYVFVQWTKSGTGDASAASGTAALVF